MVVGVALVLACTPAEPADSSGTLATGSTGASGGTDGVSSTGGASVPTTGGPAETTSEGSGEGSSAGDTGSSTGEPVRPGCGDGVLAAGEVCFERTEQDTFTRSFSQMALADLDGDGHLDLVGMGLIACPLAEHDPLRRHGVGGLASALAPSRDGAANLRVETALGDGLGGFTFKAGFEPVAISAAYTGPAAFKQTSYTWPKTDTGASAAIVSDSAHSAPALAPAPARSAASMKAGITPPRNILMTE